jgi:hypothetical protein
MLADPARSASFLSSLPSGNGTLVIHHTSWDWQESFQAVACYRVVLAGVKTCFDETAHLVLLPDEAGDGD